MVTLRCTQKLLQRLGAAADARPGPPTTVVGDWYASILHRRPQQLVICMNERTLLVVLIPAREIKSMGERFRDAAIAQLRRIGVAPVAMEAEAQAMCDVGVGPVASRSILGCLREANLCRSIDVKHPRYSTLPEIEDYLGKNIYSAAKYQRPREHALELLGYRRT